VKVTPFFARTRPLNRFQMWFNWDLHVVADVYTGMSEELRATREGVSMGDMSPLSKHELSGPDAQRFLDRLVTRDMTGVEVGQVVYTPWCDERGKVVGDGLVFRTGEDRFRITADAQFEWLALQAEGMDVSIGDVTDDFGLLAVQGPRSAEVMSALTGAEWASLPFSRTRTVGVAGADVLVARQGFTGELGFELWVPAEAGVAVWDAVTEAGGPFEIRPVGEYAIDVARVEAGFLIVGADYTGAGPDRAGSVVELSADHHASPYEIGLGTFVDLRKDAFVGRDALAAEHDAGGPRLRLAGLALDQSSILAAHSSGGRLPLIPNRVWWYPLPVRKGGSPIGHATSVTWAPSVGKVVGFGHLEAGVDEGDSVDVEWAMGDATGVIPATVVPLPFLQIRRAS
jgi:aminomethyltransferase